VTVESVATRRRSTSVSAWRDALHHAAEAAHAFPGLVLIVDLSGSVRYAWRGPGVTRTVPEPGSAVHAALGIREDSPEAARLQVWLMCLDGADRASWDVNLPNAPTRLQASGCASGMELDLAYGPLFDRGRLGMVAFYVREVEMASSRVQDGPTSEAVATFLRDVVGTLADCDAAAARIADDREARHAVHKLFRALHTIKGNAMSVGQVELAELANQAESVLHVIRSQREPVSDAQLADIRSYLQALRAHVGPLTGDATSPSAKDALTAFLDVARPLVVELGRAYACWFDQLRNRDLLERLGSVAADYVSVVQKFKLSALAGVAAELGKHVDECAHATRPRRQSVARIEQLIAELDTRHRVYQTLSVEVQANRSGERLAASVAALLAAEAPDVAELAALAERAGAPSLAAELEADPVAGPARVVGALRDLPAFSAPVPASDAQPAPAVALRRAFARLAAELGPSASVSLDELRHAMFAAVGVTLDPVEDRLRKTVAEVSAMLGKRVAFAFRGAGTVLAAEVQRALCDVLVHAVRNALDHGIELPEVRRARGKRPVGRVDIDVTRHGPWLQVAITDDGAGIDRDRVRRRAVERGLITSDVAARLSDADVDELLFVPGFTTTEQVTMVSGRGVGMDVVRQVARELGGDARLTSQPGVGTRVELVVIDDPLALPGA
jgi:chemotaxis protein histidine kinase CheA